MASRRLAVSACGAVSLLALSGVAAAQGATPGPGSGPDPAVGIGARFVGSFLVFLLLGGGLVALAPAYARGRVDEIRDDPGAAFGWGLIVGIAVPIALLLIALTIVGIVVTIAGFVVLFFVGIAGNAVTVVWIGTLVTGDADARIGATTALVGALVLAVPAAIPVLGSLVTTIVGYVGLGVVGRDLYDSWGSGRSRRARSGAY